MTIARREFMTRVRKKSFLIMTIIGPVLFGGLIVIPALLTSSPASERHLLVLDNSFLLVGQESLPGLEFEYLDPLEIEEAQALEIYESSDQFDGLLIIPKSAQGDPDYMIQNAKIYNKGAIGIDAQKSVERFLQREATNEKLRQQGVDPASVAAAHSSARVGVVDLNDNSDTENALEFKMAAGYLFSFFIYIFIFMYAVQTMRGVIEEKTSRIVEVIVSSVKPTQLMLGKIVGTASVGFLQFSIWVLLTVGIYQGVAAAGLFDVDAASGTVGMAQKVFSNLASFNATLMLGSFLFFFLGGFLLYASLFAAVGAAVDSETDTQQFMLPLTIPLVISFLLATRFMTDPGSDLAVWMSIFPLTSPVTMMMRLPFGVPGWQLGLSMLSLVLGFLGTTWLAGRIYRIGILSFGKKPTYREIWRWIRMKP